MLEKINGKTCLHCKQLKPFSEFSPDPTKHDKLDIYCKESRRFLDRQRRRKAQGLPPEPDPYAGLGHKKLPLVSTRQPKKTKKAKSSPAKPIAFAPEKTQESIRSQVLEYFYQATGVMPSQTIEKIRQEWWHPAELIQDDVVDGYIIITLHTGGWSGNQDIINVLMSSGFWRDWWERSERGGTYMFKIDESVWANGLDFKR